MTNATLGSKGKDMKIQVNSEIGKLKKVFVHRPGREVERIYPEIFERLLFDDIMDLPMAQKEHDDFVAELEKRGIEVFYIERLVASVLDREPKLRGAMVSDFLEGAKIKNSLIKQRIKEFFLSITNNQELVDALIAGVKKSEVLFDDVAKENVEVHQIVNDSYPFFIDPIPNILFHRDPIVSIFNDVNINSMTRETRRRERIFFDYLFQYHPDFNKHQSLLGKTDGGNIEGGDILVFSKKCLFAGLSERTTLEGIENLAKKLFLKYPELEQIVGVEIPKNHATMHLDTVLTQMDRDKFLIDAEMYKLKYEIKVISYRNGKLHVRQESVLIPNLLKEFVCSNPKFVVVGDGEIVRSKREQWNDAANCLTIAPGEIVVYSRNYVTNNLVEKIGVKAVKIVGSELSRGRGGPRCMTMPIERDEI